MTSFDIRVSSKTKAYFKYYKTNFISLPVGKHIYFIQMIDNAKVVVYFTWLPEESVEFCRNKI